MCLVMISYDSDICSLLQVVEVNEGFEDHFLSLLLGNFVQFTWKALSEKMIGIL